MTRCVLFDFDGTLIDTWRLYLESFRRSLAPHFNRLLSDEEILDYRPSAERRLLKSVIEDGHVNRYYESFLGHYRSLHHTHNDGLYPGVADMLAGLRSGGYLLGVVTGKSRPAWDVTFAASGLPPFDVIITDDDVIQPKPHPEGLLTALKTVGVPASRAFYIGDSLLDGEAAGAAGIAFGAALWSKSGLERDRFRAEAEGIGVMQFFDAPFLVATRLLAWTAGEACTTLPRD